MRDLELFERRPRRRARRAARRRRARVVHSRSGEAASIAACVATLRSSATGRRRRDAGTERHRRPRGAVQRSRSRSSGGGGKYSSSSTVTSTTSTPSRGASRSRTSSTSHSGAEAPAVTPTVPARSSGSSSAQLTRSTRGQPAAVATLASETVFEEFAEPITTTASQRRRRSRAAPPGGWSWRSRGRSVRHPELGEALLRPFGDPPCHSSWGSVVWASSATGAVGLVERVDVGLATRRGAPPPARPPSCRSPPRGRRGRRRRRCSPCSARTFSSWWTLVTSGQTALTTARPSAGGGRLDLRGGAVRGEHQRRARRDLVDVVDEDRRPGARNSSTTRRLWTISW